MPVPAAGQPVPQAVEAWREGGGRITPYPCDVPWYGWMGFSMRTADWRFTEWCGFNYTRAYPVWDEADAFGCQLELYPHEGDDGKNMDLFENVPLAKRLF